MSLCNHTVKNKGVLRRVLVDVRFVLSLAELLSRTLRFLTVSDG